ncbi:MAG: hypothetical protein M3414_09990 [Pseudomonadota bacterium]|nr:hypothetical protein [Pseudomonadota bacterium]
MKKHVHQLKPGSPYGHLIPHVVEQMKRDVILDSLGPKQFAEFLDWMLWAVQDEDQTLASVQVFRQSPADDETLRAADQGGDGPALRALASNTRAEDAGLLENQADGHDSLAVTVMLEFATKRCSCRLEGE